ncbi:hypothetical protein BDV95DRAFT_482394 [Massariosphaeria phaeospora]|uniref:Uncharacterized protein n=1 Tax=Massariosphaeria phaeospora TaxID=100035 RepID=A0A7C8MF88_9PLEO|nr:hypothetical protein BDV95DRAFT_482394 [Massariosphaeria phaeospora]
MNGRKSAIAAAGTFFSLFAFSQIYQLALFSKLTPWSEQSEEGPWLASSHSWVDRKVCSWFGICGLTHVNTSGWSTNGRHREQQAVLNGNQEEEVDLSAFWKSARVRPEDWSEEEQQEREIPQYVLDHAPLIHLYSGEQFWPGDIAEHLIHTTPHLNYTPLQATDDHPNLSHLNDLNKWGRFVYLQSDDNVEDRPDWLGGEVNIPDVPHDLDTDPGDDEDDRKHGHFTEDRKEKDRVLAMTPEGEKRLVTDDDSHSKRTRRRLNIFGKKVVGGKSDAPVPLVLVPKDHGVVDAFWFFFYSYNQGNAVFNVRFGNHVGDWEHTVIRFVDGVPKAVFYSEHSAGEAYTWEAVEKVGKRPIGYSATGTHAMYATAGLHPYVLPGGILHDVTDRGPLWDPLQNMYSFTYDHRQDRLLGSNITPQAPIGWFYYGGHWGDKFYPLSDARQYRFLGQYHYVNGPLGPRFKNLGRHQICQGDGECVLKRRTSTRGVGSMKRFPAVGEGEEMSDEDVHRFSGPEAEFVP